MGNRIRALQTRLTMLIVTDEGMSTVEYSNVRGYTDAALVRRDRLLGGSGTNIP
ncbi:hypothetical protein [Mycolicibacterium sp. XJ1904]